ncbi:MAG: hypothetical protein U0704_07600 [Candidatus Eisenbacteria bacterium]
MHSSGPCSRSWEGRWLVTTQPFSILLNLALGAVLVSAWHTRALPVTAIAGLCFLLTGIERFAEAAYRGGTLARVIRGLKEPRWIDLSSIVGRLLLAMTPSGPPPPDTLVPSGASAAEMLATGAIATLAMRIRLPAVEADLREAQRPSDAKAARTSTFGQGMKARGLGATHSSLSFPYR